MRDINRSETSGTSPKVTIGPSKGEECCIRLPVGTGNDVRGAGNDGLLKIPDQVRNDKEDQVRNDKEDQVRNDKED